MGERPSECLLAVHSGTARQWDRYGPLPNALTEALGFASQTR